MAQAQTSNSKPLARGREKQGDSRAFASGGAAGEALLERLLAEATQAQASNMHLEPLADGGAAQWFRIAGKRVRRADLPAAEVDALSDAILAAAGLQVEPDAPQRGWLNWAGERVGVALLPQAQGLRIALAREAVASGERGLESLGMPGGLAGEVRRALQRCGLVLVAGPERAGRTTTLQALLRVAADDARSGLAIGAGFDGGGAAPAAVSPSDAVPMADWIRSGIDQDFDVLLIDSLDERNAARAAIEAALSGRLVLAGIVAPNAVGALGQMRSWRVDAFQLASSLNIVLAQRLARRLCAACREPVQAQGSVSALLGFDPGAIVYAPTGCSACDGSGFAGDTGVFEAIRADADIRRLINDGGDEAILARHAFVAAPNLGSAARALARSGVTTPEEAVRISRG